MKTEVIKRTHWNAKKGAPRVEYTLKLGESLPEAIEMHGEEEVLFAYQIGAKAITGSRLQAACAPGGEGPRSKPGLELSQVKDWLKGGISLSPARIKVSDNAKYVAYVSGLPPEERAKKLEELRALLDVMPQEEKAK